MKTADEYRASVLALRSAAEGQPWSVTEVLLGEDPYAYATLRAEPAREDAGSVMLGLVDLAMSVDGYLTMHTYPDADHVTIDVAFSGPAGAIDHEVRQ